MKTQLLSLTVVLMLAAAGGSAFAQADLAPYKRDIPVKLAAEAKISEDAARATALSKVPRGQIASLELEREGGQLLYSFDIKVPGKAGIDEVHINAIDGRVLSVQHESAANERAEAAADTKEAAKNK
jgi:uncharacterized membrane protein YkoI